MQGDKVNLISLGVTSNGKFYVLGDGNGNEAFDFESNVW
jgi:hypothetical protein